MKTQKTPSLNLRRKRNTRKGSTEMVSLLKNLMKTKTMALLIINIRICLEARKGSKKTQGETSLMTFLNRILIKINFKLVIMPVRKI